jgi:hypothetical protein
MNISDPRIPGGYILYARQFLERLADAPLLDRVLWTWLNCKACHTGRSAFRGHLARGQLFTTLDELATALRWRRGYIVDKPRKSTVRRALGRLGERRLIDVRPTTRGIVVTICDYDLYQDPAAYERHAGAATPGTTSVVQATSDRQEGKNEKKGRGPSSSSSSRFQTFEQMNRAEAQEALDQAEAEFLADE